MRRRRLVFVVRGRPPWRGSVAFAQPGRGGSQWLTALADAQRTSWIRTDDKISVAALSKPGFEQQWKAKLDNQPRGLHGLGAGCDGERRDAVRADVARRRQLEQRVRDRQRPRLRRVAAAFRRTVARCDAACAGGITSAATRIVRLDAAGSRSRARVRGGGRGAVGYRSLLGEPGEGVPVEGRAAGPGRAAAIRRRRRGAGRGAPAGVEQGAARRGAAPRRAPARPAPGGQPVERIPGAPRREESASPFGFLFRPSGVGYVVSSDGMLHVLGLASGKDIQRPAPFLPANASGPRRLRSTRRSMPRRQGIAAARPTACGRSIWTAKPSRSCRGRPTAETSSARSPSPRTARSSRRSVPGQASGDGKANAIVALDPKDAAAEGLVLPADGRVRHGSDDRPSQRQGPRCRGDEGRTCPAAGLRIAWRRGSRHAAHCIEAVRWRRRHGRARCARRLAAARSRSEATSWILLPVTGRLAAGARHATGRIRRRGGCAEAGRRGRHALARPGWVSHDLAVAGDTAHRQRRGVRARDGRALDSGRDEHPAVLHAYDGATGKRLWNSGKAMTTPASPGSMWSGLGQIYIGTHDGTLHAFGFNDERRPTNGPESTAAKH